MKQTFALATLLIVSTPLVINAQQPLVVTAARTTAPLYSYEDAPGTPDADDPAVWINRRHVRQSLVIGTAKDAGLVVYDLNGTRLQALRPPNAPHVSPVDPPTPAGVNPLPDRPCVESEEGETFGRYNNVDIAYDVRIGAHPSRRVDVAVVSDRGCDRVRFFKIDLSHPNGPLVDITAPDVPRVFPTRYDQPSAVQPDPDTSEGWHDNPVEDQNTVYGLTVAQGAHDEVFVSERERGLVRQLRLRSTPDGFLTYSVVRTFLFDTSFQLRTGTGGMYSWTPCREAVVEEPQSEGLLVDTVNDTLYVAFETIGLYKIPLRSSLPPLVTGGYRPADRTGPDLRPRLYGHR